MTNGEIIKQQIGSDGLYDLVFGDKCALCTAQDDAECGSCDGKIELAEWLRKEADEDAGTD